MRMFICYYELRVVQQCVKMTLETGQKILKSREKMNSKYISDCLDTSKDQPFLITYKTEDEEYTDALIALDKKISQYYWEESQPILSSLEIEMLDTILGGFLELDREKLEKSKINYDTLRSAYKMVHKIKRSL